jgi:hypothetical protein
MITEIFSSVYSWFFKSSNDSENKLNEIIIENNKEPEFSKPIAYKNINQTQILL